MVTKFHTNFASVINKNMRILSCFFFLLDSVIFYTFANIYRLNNSNPQSLTPLTILLSWFFHIKVFVCVLRFYIVFVVLKIFTSTVQHKRMLADGTLIDMKREPEHL